MRSFICHADSFFGGETIRKPNILAGWGGADSNELIQDSIDIGNVTR